MSVVNRLPSLDRKAIQFVQTEDGETELHRMRNAFEAEVEGLIDTPDANPETISKQILLLTTQRGICEWEMNRASQEALFYIAYRNMHFPSNRKWKDKAMYALVQDTFRYDMAELSISQKDWEVRNLALCKQLEAERAKQREECDDFY